MANQGTGKPRFVRVRKARVVVSSESTGIAANMEKTVATEEAPLPSLAAGTVAGVAARPEAEIAGNVPKISGPTVGTLANIVNRSFTPERLSLLLSQPIMSALGQIEDARAKTMQSKAKKICFLSPILPHPCELELWNSVSKKLGVEAIVLTGKVEQKRFENFVQGCHASGQSVHLDCSYFETIPENKTFLAGIDGILATSSLVVAVGETSLSTYQALKARQHRQNRLLVWQTAPRPPEATIGSRGPGGIPQPSLARERTVRKEILKTCDAVISFDKDSSTWAYLENVHAQRIRRITRGLNLKRFSIEMNASQRIELRESLGLPETDFIFLQAGSLEIETGALDSVYAFKSLLQSHPSFLNNTKLVFCGTGSAGADVRQAVVDLQLDNHVFFLNPNDENTLQVLGNQLVNLLAICDAVIHNPLTSVNGNPLRNTDCTYDVLCALASGLTVVSNGNGWIGEWIGRFYHVFATGNVHSQAKLMREAIEKQERLANLKKGVRTAIENELSLDKATAELASVLHGMLEVEVRIVDENVGNLITNIDNLIKARKYLDAIQFISKAFEIKELTNPQRSTLFRYIGDAFTKLGDMESGQENYLRALELDPYCVKSLIGLGTVALQRQDYNVAVPHFQKAISMAPNDDLATLGLALAFEGLGEMQQALTWSARACHLNIENTAAIYHVVKAAYDLDQFEQAEEILRRYVTLHPHDVNMTFTLGGIAFKVGKVEMATSLMEAILTLDPMNARAHGLLAQMQRKNDLLRKQA